jgi:hypothetical protein
MSTLRATGVLKFRFAAVQTLKLGGGSPQWKRFFILVGSIFAIREKCPVVPGTDTEALELLSETLKLLTSLKVVARLDGWSDVMKDIVEESESELGPNDIYLVELDVEENTTSVQGWTHDKIDEAHAAYADAERENASFPHRSAVLVSVRSVQELREAFPSYYGDTRAFLADLVDEMKKLMKQAEDARR